MLKKYRTVKNSTLIDIGCGTGWTTSIFGKNGFDVTGLEPSETRSKFARDTYGIRTLTGHIENFDSREIYGTAVLRHVIEHVEDPKSVIKRAGLLLDNQGLLLLVCPNINSLGRYLFGAQWSSWGLPWHCNFFTPKSMEALLGRSGFEVLKSYQTPSPLHFTQSLLNKYANKKICRIMENNKIFSILLSAPFAVLGTSLGLGDNLNIIARKK
jgi:2-polyprenyl-3-methyl-5-hydroxy-6-metoxy-1,4-benzoquinol methylase